MPAVRHFYEWLTGEQLQVPERLGQLCGPLNSNLMLTASSDRVVKVPRWRVNDNLPGSRFFCPVIVKTEAVNAAAGLDVA